MCSRCWMISSQVGLQAGVRRRITPFAEGRDLLHSTVADALPACCVPKSRTARLQMTRCGADHGQLTDHGFDVCTGDPSRAQLFHQRQGLAGVPDPYTIFLRCIISAWLRS
jgi:hypothetical protein